VLGRDFTAAAPGTRLVGDITYLKADEGWLYLAYPMVPSINIQVSMDRYDGGSWPFKSANAVGPYR